MPECVRLSRRSISYDACERMILATETGAEILICAIDCAHGQRMRAAALRGELFKLPGDAKKFVLPPEPPLFGHAVRSADILDVARPEERTENLGKAQQEGASGKSGETRKKAVRPEKAEAAQTAKGRDAIPAAPEISRVGAQNTPVALASPERSDPGPDLKMLAEMLRYVFKRYPKADSQGVRFLSLLASEYGFRGDAAAFTESCKAAGLTVSKVGGRNYLIFDARARDLAGRSTKAGSAA